MLKPRIQPTFKGFLTCWTCAAMCADFDVVVSASPCMLQCRRCATEARQVFVAGRIRADGTAEALPARPLANGSAVALEAA